MNTGMDLSTYRSWLAQLKAGDEVAVRNSQASGVDRIVKIDRATIGGRGSTITIAGDRFTNGMRHYPPYHYDLLPVTQAHRDEAEKSRIANYLCGVRYGAWRSLGVEPLRAIVATLAGGAK